MKKYTEAVLEAPDDELVCWCAGVSAGTIRAAVTQGAQSLEDIRSVTGACINGDCKHNNPRGRCCSTEIVKLLSQKESIPTKCCNCGITKPNRKAL